MYKLEKQIRKLAKKIENQNLFTASREINGIKLFKNSFDFSKTQILFLSYLYFYYNLMTDIVVKNVSEKVLDDEIFEDAYAYWKSKYEKKSKKDKKNQPRDIHIVFDKPNKEVK